MTPRPSYSQVQQATIVSNLRTDVSWPPMPADLNNKCRHSGRIRRCKRCWSGEQSGSNHSNNDDSEEVAMHAAISLALQVAQQRQPVARWNNQDQAAPSEYVAESQRWAGMTLEPVWQMRHFQVHLESGRRGTETKSGTVCLTRW